MTTVINYNRHHSSKKDASKLNSFRISGITSSYKLLDYCSLDVIFWIPSGIMSKTTPVTMLTVLVAEPAASAFLKNLKTSKQTLF